MYYEIEDELGNISTFQGREKEEVDETRALEVNDLAPFFYLKNDEGIPTTSLTGLSSAGESRSLLDLIHFKPLVLTFYCNCWGRYAPKHLEMLKDLAPKVEALGGQLLVLTNESQKEIGKIIRKLELELPVYQDQRYDVARAYGVYSETSPVWDRIAGISEEVFTPALFVIGADRRISYAFVDDNFDDSPDSKEVLKAIYNNRKRG